MKRRKKRTKMRKRMRMRKSSAERVERMRV